MNTVKVVEKDVMYLRVWVNGEWKGEVVVVVRVKESGQDKEYHNYNMVVKKIPNDFKDLITNYS